VGDPDGGIDPPRHPKERTAPPIAPPPARVRLRPVAPWGPGPAGKAPLTASLDGQGRI